MYKICALVPLAPIVPFVPPVPLVPLVPLVHLLGTLLLCQDPSTSAPWCLQTDPLVSLSNPSVRGNPDHPGFSRSKYTLIRKTL
jgi:hypothetical protein